MTVDGETNLAPSNELMLLLLLGSRTVVERLHVYLAARGYADLRPAHAFALQRMTPNGATGNEIADFLNITKQAASEMVEYLERHGYVARQPHPVDRRGKLITLAPRGWAVLQASASIFSQMETEWVGIIGLQRMVELRADLRRLITSANDGVAPQNFRPVW